MPDSTQTHVPHTAAGLAEAGADAREDAAFDERPRSGAPTWYDVLDVPPHATAADISKAYDRMLALVEGRSIGGFLMLDPIASESIRADVDTARHILGDPTRRDAYDRWLSRRHGREVRHEPRQDAKLDARHDARPDFRADAKGDGRHDLVETRGDLKNAPARPTLPEDKTPADSDEAGAANEMPAAALQNTSTLPMSIGMDPSFRRSNTPAALRFLAPTVVEGMRGSQPGADDASTTPFDAGRVDAGRAVSEGVRAASQVGDGRSGVTQPPGSLLPTTAIPQPASSLPVGSGSGIGPSTALPEGEIDGTMIRGLREARGLSLDHVAESTKIRKPYLAAIEENDVANLPDRVYLRGFLTQVARVLKVDRVRLAEGYLQYVDRQPTTETG